MLDDSPYLLQGGCTRLQLVDLPLVRPLQLRQLAVAQVGCTLGVQPELPAIRGD